MKERPILFSGPMVQALLEGRKTVTRRPVKPQPDVLGAIRVGSEGYLWTDHSHQLFKPSGGAHRCPYGVPGDRLWVRETWAPHVDAITREEGITFRADTPDLPIKWRSSIFLKKADSRITLEVTDVRVERLQEISEMDAMREGDPDQRVLIASENTHTDWFQHGWDSLYTKKPELQWEANPWVWRVEFRKL